MIVARWLVKAVEFYATNTARIGQVAIMIMFPLLTVDVFTSYAFNKPLAGVFEVVMGLNVVAMSMYLAYVQLLKGHVWVDVFFKRYPPRLQYAANVVFYLLGLVFFGLLAGQFVTASRDSWAIKHTYAGSINVPLYPLNFLILVGTCSMCLVLLVDIVRDFSNLLRPPAVAEKRAEAGF